MVGTLIVACLLLAGLLAWQVYSKFDLESELYREKAKVKQVSRELNKEREYRDGYQRDRDFYRAECERLKEMVLSVNADPKYYAYESPLKGMDKPKKEVIITAEDVQEIADYGIY